MDLLVNGAAVSLSAEPPRRLLVVLRDELGLTGSKYGCGEGKCGACMVLVDGQPTPSCQLRVAEAAGHQILTIEGLAVDGRLHPVQQAFVTEGAMQCGYCTPGMIMGAVGLLMLHPDPSTRQITEAMNRHICRCGTYGRILKAVQRAASLMLEENAVEAQV